MVSHFQSKSDKVREHVKSGEYKKALSIVKGFRLGITREQSDAMTRAYECMVNPDFYRQLHIDTDEAVSAGINVLKELYA